MTVSILKWVHSTQIQRPYNPCGVDKWIQQNIRCNPSFGEMSWRMNAEQNDGSFLIGL